MTLELKKQIIEDAAVRIETGKEIYSCGAIFDCEKPYWPCGSDLGNRVVKEYCDFYQQTHRAFWLGLGTDEDRKHLRVMLLLWFRESLGDET